MQVKPISRNEKIEAICRRLDVAIEVKEDYIIFEKDYEGNTVCKINRFNLRNIIQAILKIVHVHTINSWVNMLMMEGIITPNPHTLLSAKEHKIKPSNDTKYILETEEIRKRASDTHIVTSQKALTNYLEPQNHNVR